MLSLLGAHAMAAAVAVGAAGIEGLVVLPDGQAVADAEVSVVGRSGHVLTDAKGRFVLAPSLRPPFELLVVLPGGRYARPVRFDSADVEPLVVAVEWQIEESVTVTAGSAPGLEGPPASGMTLVTAADVSSRAPTNLAQALENVAGASTQSEGQAAVPALRGLAAGRTLVLLDGARVTTERRAGPSATYADPSVFEAVEVARGPGSVAYGSDAFGGVILMRTRRAAPGSPFGGRFEGALGAGAPQQRASLALTKGFSRGGLLVAGHLRELDDWESPRGTVPNSSASDRGFLARADGVVGGGLLSIGLQSDFARDVGRPRTSSDVVRFFYPVEDSHRLTAGWERGVAGPFSKVGVSGFLGRYRLVTDQDRAATPATPRSVERADVSAGDFHVRGFAQRPLGRARLEAGVDLNGRSGLEALEIRERYDGEGELASREEIVAIESARRVDTGVYASVDSPVGRALAVAFGLRGDVVGNRNRGGWFGDVERTNGAISGFAALTAGPLAGFSATAQVARGFRDPTLSDRYYRGPTGRGFITGNPDLDPETSLQLDLAVRWTGRGVRAVVGAYLYDIADLVERYETAPDVFLFRNRGEARVRGVEAELQARLPWRLSLEATGHVLSGEVLDDGTPLDGIPPETLTLRLRRDADRGFAWVRLAAFGRLDRPGPTERARDGHAVLDAAVGARPLARVELTLLGRNLLDESYLVSPDSRAVLAPGRSVLVSASIRF